MLSNKRNFINLSDIGKEELNKIGSYKVEINFYSEVKANISIKIVKIQSK